MLPLLTFFLNFHKSADLTLEEVYAFADLFNEQRVWYGV